MLKVQESLFLVAFANRKKTADVMVWGSVTVRIRRKANCQHAGPSKLLRYAN